MKAIHYTEKAIDIQSKQKKEKQEDLIKRLTRLHSKQESFKRIIMSKICQLFLMAAGSLNSLLSQLHYDCKMINCMEFIRNKLVRVVIMYKAILYLFFLVICLTAIVFSSLKDSFYAFL